MSGIIQESRINLKMISSIFSFFRRVFTKTKFPKKEESKKSEKEETSMVKSYETGTETRSATFLDPRGIKDE